MRQIGHLVHEENRNSERMLLVKSFAQEFVQGGGLNLFKLKFFLYKLSLSTKSMLKTVFLGWIRFENCFFKVLNNKDANIVKILQ